MTSKLVYTSIKSYVFVYALSKRHLETNPNVEHFIIKNIRYDNFYKEICWEIWDIKLPSYQLKYTGTYKQSLLFFNQYYSLQIKNLELTENYAKFTSI